MNGGSRYLASPSLFFFPFNLTVCLLFPSTPTNLKVQHDTGFEEGRQFIAADAQSEATAEPQPPPEAHEEEEEGGDDDDAPQRKRRHHTREADEDDEANDDEDRQDRRRRDDDE